MKRLSLLLTGLCAAALFIAPPLDAGSVFMKNGYIIQGRVVEKDDDKVVLRFSNGSVTLYRRYIEEVVLEPSEIAELAPRETKVGNSDPRITTVNTVFTLPESLDVLIKTRGLDPDLVGSREPLIPSDTDPAVPTIPEQPGVELVPQPPAPFPTEEVEYAEVGMAMTVPGSWIVQQEQGQLTVKKPGLETLPRLMVQYKDLDGLDPERAVEILLEEVKTSFPQARIADDRIQQVGFQRAFVIEGMHADTNLYFTQMMLSHEGRMYLIGTQMNDARSVDVRAELESCIRSIRFLSTEKSEKK